MWRHECCCSIWFTSDTLQSWHNHATLHSFLVRISNSTPDISTHFTWSHELHDPSSSATFSSPMFPFSNCPHVSVLFTPILFSITCRLFSVDYLSVIKENFSAKGQSSFQRFAPSFLISHSQWTKTAFMKEPKLYLCARSAFLLIVSGILLMYFLYPQSRDSLSFFTIRCYLLPSDTNIPHTHYTIIPATLCQNNKNDSYFITVVKN